MATPRRRQGAPLASTDAELDAAAVPTAADVDDARAAWREDAPPGWADLLDAAPIDDPDA